MKGVSKIAILALIFFASGRLSAQTFEKIEASSDKMAKKNLGTWKILINKKEKKIQPFRQALLTRQGAITYPAYPSLPAPQQAHSFFCDIEDFLSRKLRMPVDLGPE